MALQDQGPQGSSGILQVVAGDGSFNSQGVDQFVKDTGVESSGVAYTVVAIMGPQSSGKSTLLNHLVRREGRRRAAGGVHQQQAAGTPLQRAVVAVAAAWDRQQQGRQACQQGVCSLP